MKEANRIHRFDHILRLLVPDTRKRVAGILVVHPWGASENYPLLIELIDNKFMAGPNQDGIPQVTGLTWMGMDFFNACRNENVRIRLKFRCREDAQLTQIYAAAVEIHGTHGQERNRYTRRYR